jgi:carbonic anhydrase
LTATNHADNVIDIHAHYQMNGGVQMFPWRIKAPAQSGERACLVIGCSDAPELFAGEAPPGWSKVTRVNSYGNVVPPVAGASQPIFTFLERALTRRKDSDIVVCGHTRCDALRHLLMPPDLTPDETTRAWSAHAAKTRTIMRERYLGLDGERLWEAAVQEHVLIQIEQLLTHPAVKTAVDKGQVRLQGWVHDEMEYRLYEFDPITHQFAPFAPPLPSRDTDRNGLQAT